MPVGDKYLPLTNWLKQSKKETIRFSFDELNKIIPIPCYAYRDRPSWANCTTGNCSSFQCGWMNAGYCVSGVNLQEQWVVFSKKDAQFQMYKETSITRKSYHKAIPASYEEELLLSMPNELAMLSNDQFLMVSLNKTNSDIVEKLIVTDPAYQQKGKFTMEHFFNIGDYSSKAYYSIINRIATENSTRTPQESMECLALYCADTANRFLERLQNGDAFLVDDMVHHLIQNGNRKDKSLASKICRYINEWLYNDCAYTVNDSVVRAILPYYLAYYKVDRALWQNKNLDELSYYEFYTIYSALRNAVGELNNHQLDHLIWYAYKSDPIRTEVAKALSRVL